MNRSTPPEVISGLTEWLMGKKLYSPRQLVWVITLYVKDHSIRWIMLRHCWQFCCKSPPLCRTVFKPTSSLNELGLGPSGVYLTIVSTVSSSDRSAQVSKSSKCHRCKKKKKNYGKII